MMIKTYISISIALLFVVSLSAQTFSAASQGIFNPEEKIVIMLSDSSQAEYSYDTDYENDGNLSILPLINSDGEKIEMYPEDIVRLEITRGEEPPMSLYEDDDEENEESTLSFLPEARKALIFEQVPVTKEYGTPYPGKYKDESYLLQLVSDGLGDYLKIYVAPDFENGATEFAPEGSLITNLDRNRVDYTAVEEYYFIRVGNAPAFRLHADDYVDFAPLIYENSRGFRKKYSVPKDLPKERTRKRKKTTRKNVGKKRKKVSPLRIDEFPQHIVEYHEFYVVEEAERQEKLKAREAAREARKRKQ